MDYGHHVQDFEDHRRRRMGAVRRGATAGSLHPAVVRGLQTLQVGESGDGAVLIAAAERAGDASYAAAVRLFVAEEQHHARLLADVLDHVGAATVDGHWTDTVFVALRRGSGLRLELMTLMLAEVVALRYYRALRDGTDDEVLTEVAGRILADEHRHVPFHVERLRDGFAGTPLAVRSAAAAAWWVLMAGAAVVVAVDHGSALRRLGVRRSRFVVDVLGLFRPCVGEVFGRPAVRRALPTGPAGPVRWVGRAPSG